MTHQQKYIQRQCDKWAKEQRATKPLAEIDALWLKAKAGKLKFKYRD